MKYALALLSLFLVACSHPNPKTSVVIPEKPIDTSKYSILKYDKIADDYLFDKNATPTELSYDEVLKIEAIVDAKIAEYNKSKDRSMYSLPVAHPENYFKQLLAVINSKGNKEVWVNCSCDKPDIKYWRKEWTTVSDGGNSYFGLEINLTTGVVLKFGVNGVA